MKKIFLVIALIVFLAAPLFAADVDPTYSDTQNMASYGPYLTWDLVSSAITSTGPSDVMVGGEANTKCTMYIEASGTVDISAAIQESMDNSTWFTVTTYTLSSAAVTGYTWNHPVKYMRVNFTVTTGQIDDVQVFCTK